MGGVHANTRRKISLTPEEIASQDEAAEAAGLPWAEWARRKLHTAAVRARLERSKR